MLENTNLTVLCPLEGSDFIRTSKLYCIKGILKKYLLHCLLWGLILYGKLGPSGTGQCCWVQKFVLQKAMIQIVLFGSFYAVKGHGKINGNVTSKWEKPWNMKNGMIVACSLSGIKTTVHLSVSLVLNSFMHFKSKLDARKINLTYVALIYYGRNPHTIPLWYIFKDL